MEGVSQSKMKQVPVITHHSFCPYCADPSLSLWQSSGATPVIFKLSLQGSSTWVSFLHLLVLDGIPGSLIRCFGTGYFEFSLFFVGQVYPRVPFSYTSDGDPRLCSSSISILPSRSCLGNIVLKVGRLVLRSSQSMFPPTTKLEAHS